MLQVALTDDTLLLWVDRNALRSGIYDIDVNLVSGEDEPSQP